jgi:hypothetical protein
VSAEPAPDRASTAQMPRCQQGKHPTGLAGHRRPSASRARTQHHQQGTGAPASAGREHAGQSSLFWGIQANFSQALPCYGTWGRCPCAWSPRRCQVLREKSCTIAAKAVVENSEAQNPVEQPRKQGKCLTSDVGLCVSVLASLRGREAWGQTQRMHITARRGARVAEKHRPHQRVECGEHNLACFGPIEPTCRALLAGLLRRRTCFSNRAWKAIWHKDLGLNQFQCRIHGHW